MFYQLFILLSLSFVFFNSAHPSSLKLGLSQDEKEQKKLENLETPMTSSHALKLSLSSVTPQKDIEDPLFEHDLKLIIVVSNDSFSVNLSDRHLTSRIRIGAIKRSIPQNLQGYIDARDYIIMTLSQDIYTPEDIDQAELQEDQRPYAGWLYFTLGKIKQRGNRVTVLTADIGIVGPSARAQEAQTEVHAKIGSVKPLGWQHQLSDEFGVKLNYREMFRNKFIISKYISGELIKFYGGSAGNVRTSLEAGGALRIGYNIPNDFGIGFSNLNTRSQWIIFHYIQLKGEYVIRDIFLDGNTFNESHSVEKREYIATLTAGLTAQKGKWGASLIQSISTEEFEEQDGGDSLGELRIFYNFLF